MRTRDLQANRQILFGLLTLCCSLVMTGVAQEPKNSELAPPPPPGKLVDIGGYRLHIWCMGKESERPAVVLLPGSGDFSFTWGLVQPEVAKFTRVCSYDQAFWAWSDPGPLPRTMKQEAYELYTLLHKADVKGPYVLVGASSGGLIARVFAREYRDEVAGMVLVDSTDPDTVSGKKVNGQDVDVRDREESKGRTVPPVQTVMSNPLGPLTAEEQERIDRYRENMGSPKVSDPHDRLPADLQKLDIWARFQFNPLIAKTINPFYPEEMQQLYEEAQRQPLGDIPLLVLIAGDRARTVEEQQKRAADPKRKVPNEKPQQKIAQPLISRNGMYVTVQSWHEIHLYQPAWVIEAIRQVVEAARKHTRLPQYPN
jgi:pimeloyl-ACP methyl ester carboxylesterase